MRKIRRFLRRPWSDRLLLTQTVLLLSLIRLGLKFLTFKTLYQVLPHHPLPNQDTSPHYSIQQITWAVNTASRYMPGGAKCLARALTTQVLLVRNSYATQLKIGVTKSAKGELEAHAWIENQGDVVMGGLPNLSQFKPLPALEMKL